MDVIILNGASSSGKSSIARELQAIFSENYLHIGIDSFIAMMPEKVNALEFSDKRADGFYFTSEDLNGATVQRIQCGDYGKKINQVYHSTVKHLADSGIRIIVDDVMNGGIEQNQWKSVLGSTSTLFVGVHCSLKVLTEREKCRNDRFQGSAAEQVTRVHEGVKYDLEVSTTTNSARDCAQIIATYITQR
jgi:chloramphenicol 3-O phosphotransferase